MFVILTDTFLFILKCKLGTDCNKQEEVNCHVMIRDHISFGKTGRNISFHGREVFYLGTDYKEVTIDFSIIEYEIFAFCIKVKSGEKNELFYTAPKCSVSIMLYKKYISYTRRNIVCVTLSSGR